MDPDAGRQGIGVPKEDIEAELELLQVFPLDGTERWLWTGTTLRVLAGSIGPQRGWQYRILTPTKEMIPVDLPGGGLNTETLRLNTWLQHLEDVHTRTHSPLEGSLS